MTIDPLKTTHEEFVMPTYRPGFSLVRGEGTSVWDSDGREYLDFLAGIGVLNVGHCHPHVVSAVQRQAAELMHVSNLYFNVNQPALAKRLSEASLGGKVFFCNSGAEANEAAIKLIRYWGHKQGRHRIISMTNSFHGRTLSALAATGQPQYHKGFDPMPQGFDYADFNDLASVEALISEDTAAVLVEVTQGEGGVVPGDPTFLNGLRKLCDNAGILLCVDEVQTGMGRTGHLFGYQAYDFTPDLITVAKGLGGGFPIGALVAAPHVSDVLQPGTHGSTFGGTPLACAAGLAVLDVIEDEDLCALALSKGAYFQKRLTEIFADVDEFEEVRGSGLMVGLVLNRPAADFVGLLMKHGLIALATAGTVVRFLPPLTTSDDEFERALKIIEEALAEWTPAMAEMKG